MGANQKEETGPERDNEPKAIDDHVPETVTGADTIAKGAEGADTVVPVATILYSKSEQRK